MTCKNCIHYQMCLEKFRKSKTDGFYEFIDEEEYFAHADECDFFKDKSRYIELPCKVGQDGYWLTSYGIVPVTFDKILLSVGNEWKVRAKYFVKETAYCLFEDFGKTVFFTREEAEKALAERSEKNA